MLDMLGFNRLNFRQFEMAVSKGGDMIRSFYFPVPRDHLRNHSYNVVAFLQVVLTGVKFCLTNSSDAC
jgi:hypothetical protein